VLWAGSSSADDGFSIQNGQLQTLRIGDCVRNPLPALRSRPVDVGTPDHVDRPYDESVMNRSIGLRSP
jgi:hypothetical protein